MKGEAQDPRSFLDTADLQRDLRARSISGAFVTLGAQGIKFGLHFGALLVLARLLTPDDFGLVGMVLALTGFIVLFKDLGLSAATVQRAEVTHEQISTLFWVNAVLSAIAMLLAIVVAPAIAAFYGEPRLTWITVALAGGFLLSGMTVQHQALLRRRMHFRSLAVAEIIAQAVSAATGVVAAWLGAGYWALVLQQLAFAAGNLIAVWIACGWRPGRPVRGSGVRPMLRFGSHLTWFGFVNYLARNLDNVLIGRAWGAAPLGLYTRAYALLTLPLNQINAPISGIAIPTLSRLQDQPERYARYYLRAVGLIALASMPLVALLWALSREVVLVVLSDQWIAAADLFSILAFAAFVQPVISTGGWVYVSLGQTDRMAKWGIPLAALLSLSFVIGLPWGPKGVALAYTAAIYVLAVPALWAAYRYSPITLVALARTVRRPATLGLVSGATAHLARSWFGPASPLAVIAGCAAVATAATALMVLAWPALRGDFKNLWSLFGELRSGAGAEASAGQPESVNGQGQQ